MQIFVEEIPVEIVRKRIKNMYLRVLGPEGRVQVTAPQRISEDSILLFVQSKISWIRRQQALLQDLPQPEEHQYVSGETLSVWGQPYVLQVGTCSRGHSVALEGDQVLLTLRAGSSAEQREAILRAWYRSLLKDQVEMLLPRWEAITGLWCSGWQSKYMTSRWGTCNTSTRKIWLNVQLAQKPLACLEYVILHELAHLKVRGHGADFKALLDQYMPDWRERRKLLKDSR